jgi:hypothetical protein
MRRAYISGVDPGPSLRWQIAILKFTIRAQEKRTPNFWNARLGERTTEICERSCTCDHGSDGGVIVGCSPPFLYIFRENISQSAGLGRINQFT